MKSFWLKVFGCCYITFWLLTAIGLVYTPGKPADWVTLFPQGSLLFREVHYYLPHSYLPSSLLSAVPDVGGLSHIMQLMLQPGHWFFLVIHVVLGIFLWRGQLWTCARCRRSVMLAYAVIFISVYSLEMLNPSKWPHSHRGGVQVGAHYYLWFPENWVAKTLGDYTVPPIEPLWGKYHTKDKAVFKEHVSWARQAGIGYFIFDWWAQNTVARTRLDKIVADTSLLRDQNGEVQMQFAIQYEPFDLKTRGDQAYAGESANIVVLDQARVERLKKHVELLARKYMGHPAYYRIDGRPVLYLYAARHVVGANVGEALLEVKRHVKEVTGQDVFLVGDEVYYNVLATNRHDTIIMLHRGQINWERMRAFDGITCYNPYHKELDATTGAGVRRFLAEVKSLYARYDGASRLMGQVFIPGVIPGYNDRGVRGGEKNVVIPRIFSDKESADAEWSDGKLLDEKVFFEEAWKQWVLPLMEQSNGRRDPDDILYPVAITSWNEWNEWSQVEPTKQSLCTKVDGSPTGFDTTQGLFHCGYGDYYMKSISSMVKITAELGRGAN